MSAKRRPGSDSPFSKLFTDAAYGVSESSAPVVEPEPEPVSAPISAPVPASVPKPEPVSAPVSEPVIAPPVVNPVPPDGPAGQAAAAPAPRRRGRPATGKRSDPNWLGRTFYINKDIDSQVEIELLKLKQKQGVELDKSELVNGLLAAWLQAQQTEQPSVSMAEILKIQRPQDHPD